MRRLTAKMVRSGLVTAWRLAGWPTRRSPSSVKATIEGVVRMPSAFSMTLGVEPSITATQELVVPRSMPMTFAMVLYPLFAAGRVGLNSARGKVDRAGLTPADHPLVRPPFDTLSPRIAAAIAHIGGPYRPARQQAMKAQGFSPRGEALAAWRESPEPADIPQTRADGQERRPIR